ncbi:hypothetical protein LTS06_011480, partial [Exophiala xenobiotica]
MSLESTYGWSLHNETAVSSVAGFSRGRIHTLQDLLRYVQALGLEQINNARLGRVRKLGHGASFDVEEYHDTQIGKGVAVKRIKLPNSSTSFKAFQERVTCVLRDIDVMHHKPIAAHENVLGLLGYGWGTNKGDIIPYIVTELAEQRSLREYLRLNSASFGLMQNVCGGIFGGLYELHLCGIAHGDLKLENVLVVEPAPGKIIVKISDFGHSFILASGDICTVSNYRGTE